VKSRSPGLTTVAHKEAKKNQNLTAVPNFESRGTTPERGNTTDHHAPSRNIASENSSRTAAFEVNKGERARTELLFCGAKPPKKIFPFPSSRPVPNVGKVSLRRQFWKKVIPRRVRGTRKPKGDNIPLNRGKRMKNRLCRIASKTPLPSTDQSRSAAFRTHG